MSQNLELYRGLRDESLWTPDIVYDVPPPNTLVRESYNYGEGADGYSQEATRGSLLDGVADFFSKLLGGIGSVIGGAVQAGVGLLSHVVSGVTNLIGGIARAIGSIFGGSDRNPSPPPPPEPVFSPIKASLEEAVEPLYEQTEALAAESAEIGEKARSANEQIEILLSDSADSRLWVLQNEINDLILDRQNILDAALEIVQENLAETQDYIPRTISFNSSGSYNDHFEIVNTGRERVIRAKGSWVGTIVFSGEKSRSITLKDSSEGSNHTFTVIEPDIWTSGFPLTLETPRERTTSCTSGIITYFIDPGELFSEKVNYGGFQHPGGGQWVPAPAETRFTAEYSGTHIYDFYAGWNAATHHNYYGLRILVNNRVVRTVGPETKLGPLFPGTNGYRVQRITISELSLNKGDVVRAELYSDASNNSQRYIKDFRRVTSWIIPAEAL